MSARRPVKVGSRVSSELNKHRADSEFEQNRDRLEISEDEVESLFSRWAQGRNQVERYGSAARRHDASKEDKANDVVAEQKVSGSP
jgi:hypothetical protein